MEDKKNYEKEKKKEKKEKKKNLLCMKLLNQRNSATCTRSRFNVEAPLITWVFVSDINSTFHSINSMFHSILIGQKKRISWDKDTADFFYNIIKEEIMGLV